MSRRGPCRNHLRWLGPEPLLELGAGRAEEDEAGDPLRRRAEGGEHGVGISRPAGHPAGGKAQGVRGDAAGSCRRRRRTAAAPRPGSCGRRVGLERATISSGAWRAKRSFASSSSRPGVGIVDPVGGVEQRREGVAPVLRDMDEAPGMELAVVGRAHRGGEDRGRARPASAPARRGRAGGRSGGSRAGERGGAVVEHRPTR